MSKEKTPSAPAKRNPKKGSSLIEGFSVQSFRLNDAVISTFVNFHRRPKLGLQSTIWYETVKLCGAD